ncbi:MAG: AMP-binding protein [Oscillospiraceae bacterium]|nr:AMP-binding protein [Oscillospiraceae bacterium]
MILLERIWENLQQKKATSAYCCEEATLTYGELNLWAGRLCAYLQEHFCRGTPLIVYGHKQRMMAVAFLACAFGGFPYIPVDRDTPLPRMRAILRSAQPQAILAVDPLEGDGVPVVELAELERICSGTERAELPYPQRGPEEIFYLIFTSGSTGTPKGVAVTCGNLDSFVRWMATLFPNPPAVIINQAAFSFDLSIADFWPALAWGAQEYVLSRSTQRDYPRLFSRLDQSDGELMVLTPSFAALLLADKSFCRRHMPRLRVMFFCGEPLPPGTAQQLLERFPGLGIFNAYGPTECTVAVTAAAIGIKEARLSHLPVGQAKPGVEIRIEDSGNLLPEGETGEIVIVGDSVAAGYMGDADNPSFGRRDGKRSYRTGDMGRLENGVLYCQGRWDLQVKIQGYRVELRDVEENLCVIPDVEEAVVVCKKALDGQVLRLVAFVRMRAGKESSATRLRALLTQRLPGYMCPAIRLMERFPLNQNGKCDRKRLEEMANGRTNFGTDPADRK